MPWEEATPPRAPAAKSKAWSLVFIHVGLEEANGSPVGFNSQPKGRGVTPHGVQVTCSATASLHRGRGPARGAPGKPPWSGQRPP